MLRWPDGRFIISFFAVMLLTRVLSRLLRDPTEAGGPVKLASLFLQII